MMSSNRMLAAAASLAWLGAAYAMPWVGFGQDHPAQATRKTTDPPIAATGKLGQDLFLAIDRRALPEVQALLGKGADPNARNGLQFTPLFVASASHQPEVMRALIGSKADVRADSPYGTAMLFAAATGHTEGVRILLARGAHVNPPRIDGINSLMMAANAGNPETVAMLISHRARVNEANNYGATALTFAARAGHVPVGKLLLDAGAKVDLADSQGQTPLMTAAMCGHTEFVKMLLDKGAKPSLRDSSRRTALLLAASYGEYPDVVRALLAAGASRTARDAKGRTAADLASARGYSASASILGKKAAVKPREPRKAITSGLRLLEGSMNAFSEGTACISCHQEGLGRMATGVARLKGFGIDKSLLRAQAGRIQGALGAMRPLHEGALKNPEVMKQVPLIEINEVSTIDGWLLSGMAAHKEASSEATAAMAMVLARQQAPNGSWTFSLPRVPMQSSVHGFTALAIRSLKAYGPKSATGELSDRIDKGRQWLLTAPATSSDDLAFRLLGLGWAGTAMADRQKAIDELVAAQNPDGGWSQLPGMPSDAYATGQAVYALATSGEMTSKSGPVAKGTAYLLRTQDDDGSWFVRKRAIPANNYYDAKFPHGESQYSSFNGTCWAVMALLETTASK